MHAWHGQIEPIKTKNIPRKFLQRSPLAHNAQAANSQGSPHLKSLNSHRDKQAETAKSWHLAKNMGQRSKR
jgi:hypothetical protein